MKYFLLLFLLFPISAFSAEIYVDKNGESCEGILKGPIIEGDFAKLEGIVQECSAMGSQFNQIVLDGGGADFLEGIKIGNLLFNNGWTTRIKREGVCDGACAYAFLGGRFFGASIGWGASRKMEFGGVLGFNALYADLPRRGTIEKKTSFDQTLVLALLEYLEKIKINPELAITLLRLNKKNMLYVNKPGLLKKLDIEVYNAPASIREFLSSNRAIAIAKDILLERQPEDWEFSPAIKTITGRAFKKELLEMAALREKGDGDELFPLASEIGKALKSNSAHAINALFDELNSLKVAPVSPGKDAKILKITGLDNVHAYLSKTAYFFIYNDGTPQLSVDYAFFGAPEFSWDVFSGHLKKYGELMYDLYDPDMELWQVGDGD